MLRCREAVLEHRHQPRVVAREQRRRIDPEPRGCCQADNAIVGRFELSACTKIEPPQSPLAQRDDEIFVNTIPCVVVLFRVQVDSARAVGDLGNQLRCAEDVVVVGRAGLSARFGEQAEIEVRLRLGIFPEQYRRVVADLDAWRPGGIRDEERAEEGMEVAC